MSGELRPDCFPTMFDSSTCIYGLKYPGVAVCANLTETEKHQFVVGTCSVRESNEITLLEFDEDEEDVKCKGIFRHSGQVLGLATCPFAPELVLVTSHPNEQGDGRLVLYKGLSADDDNPDDIQVRDLEKTWDLSAAHTSPVVGVCCHPLADMDSGEEEHTCVSIEHNGISKWDMSQAGSSPVASAAVRDPSKIIRSGCWDPHHTNNFVTVEGDSIVVRDLRTLGDEKKSAGLVLERAHQGQILSVDYNPNKPFHIVTAGEDRLARIFDLRKPDHALKVLGGHTHWINTASYNRFHDQLLLTSGTDSLVKLWSVVSVSSAPLGELEDPQNEKEGDKVVGNYDSHEESVMGTAWSCYDAWVFASLSYDGRVVVNHVPTTEKYKILL